MKNLLHSFINSPTLFSILCSIIIIIGIPLALYWFTQEYDEKLGAAYLTFLIAAAVIFLIFDRIMVFMIKPRMLTIIELIILFSIYLLVSFRLKKIIVDLNDYPHNHFMIILNEGNHTNTPLRYTFPFNKTVNTNGKHFVINSSMKDQYDIIAKPAKLWNMSVKRVRTVNGVSVIFQYPITEKFEDVKIDSLIREELGL